MQNKLVRFSTLVLSLSALLSAGTSLAAPVEPAVRLQLARTAADRAGLRQVGLDFRDLYGVIHAESSWIARDGKGRNGVTSEGLAQFEPATAKAVGLRDPNNAVEAINAAARLLHEAAEWSAQRIAGLRLAPDERAAKLREGVSVYYNLSTKSRNAWSGLNTGSLPIETQRHIRNVREGARQADQLNARLGGARLPPLPAVESIDVAVNAAAPARAGAKVAGRSYVVLANGAVRPEGKGDVPAGAIRFTPRANG
jgi:hypothetical protein